MASYFDDNDDLRWYVDHGIDWEPIVRLTEYDGRAPDALSPTEAVEVYRDVLRLIGEFTAEEVAPLAATFDREHPRLEDGEVVYPEAWTTLFEQIADLGLHGLTVPRELGGLNAPLLVNLIGLELWSRADVSVCAHQGFHGSMAMAALMYSVLEGTTEIDPEAGGVTHTRFAEMIREIVAGEAWGSMDITEPHAGSDMAALRCRAEQGEDGQWRVTGPKIFITSGHGKYHFVIARTEGAAEPDDPFSGLNGLSMFLVPAWTEDAEGNRVRHVTLDGIEEKLGHAGSATVAISFEDAPAELIGERGEGFRYMLLLMNGARVGIGFEAVGLMEASYRLAKDYAAQRPSMGRTLDQHEMIADYLEEMRTDIQAIRALSMAAGTHVEMGNKLKLALQFFPPEDPEERKRLERQQRRHDRHARHLTPLLKYLAGEKAVEVAQRGVQILGGAGYMREYGAEKLLRDAMVLPIYEGTSQIQALMAMKDNLLGAVRDPARFVQRTAQARWRSLSSRDPLERRVARLQSTAYGTLQFLLSRLATSKLRELRHHPLGDWGKVMTGWDPKRDFGLAMLHAERLTRILADVAAAKELLRQSRRDPSRGEVLERWLDRAEPRCRFLHDEITTTGPRLLRALHGSPPEESGDRAAK